MAPEPSNTALPPSYKRGRRRGFVEPSALEILSYIGGGRSRKAGREGRVEAFRAALAPLRETLKRQPFIGGDGPLFADYIVFGPLQWARVISPFPTLAGDDPVTDWLERLLDVNGGGGRAIPAA